MRQALYRAYRPRGFEEVVGQEHITTVLKNEMKLGRPSHAYLFVGSRGTGKTTCAKLVAKAVNCLDLKEDGSPCGVCACCKGVDDGTLLDVTEIDAASNNGVDNIRELRDEAVFTPAVAKYRVYIIDEVHMLSTSAFNALLKILEEPPAHVIFVLATTEIHKVLPTIVSRCQRFDFHRLESGVMAGRLLDVAGREGIVLADDAAALIARLADGGMRDALSLLDVCAAQANEVTVQSVRAAAGLLGAEHLLELTGHILKQDTGAVLQAMAELTAKSLEPQRLCEQLIGHYRNLMLAKTVTDCAELVGCLPTELDALREQAKQISLSALLDSLTLLQETATRMGRSAVKRAELELALVTLCEPAARTGTAALLARLERLEQTAARTPAPAAPTPVAPAPGSSAPLVRSDSPPEPPPPAVPTAPTPGSSAPLARSDSPPEATSTSAPTPFPAWPQVLEQLGSVNPSVAGLLTNTTAFCDGKRVLIDITNPLLLKMLKENEYTRSCIKQAVTAVTGRQYGLGPYRAPKPVEQSADPLETLIESLPQSDDYVIR